MSNKVDYVYEQVIIPLIDGDRSYVNLGEIRSKLNDNNINSQTSEKEFYQNLEMALNRFEKTKIIMRIKPSDDNRYNLQRMVLFHGLSTGKVADEVHANVERMTINSIINDLDFKLPPKFVEKYILKDTHSFSEFKKEIIDEKKKNDWKTSLWVQTNFVLPEITDYFNVAIDLGFFDKIIVHDLNRYAFVLDQERFKSEKYPLCYVGNDLAHLTK